MTLADMMTRLRLVNPIMKREMVQRMRAPWAAWLLCLYVGFLGGATLLYLFLTSDSSVGTSFSPRFGLLVFSFLTTLQVYLLAMLAPSVGAAAVAEERARGTFDLLLVSEMGPLSILLGKLGSAVAFQLLLVAAGAPLYSLMFLFGGVGWKEVFICLAVLVSAVFLFSAASLAVSALFRRESAAVVTSYLLILSVLGAPLLMNLLPEASAFTRVGRVQKRSAPWVQALSPGRVISATLGLNGGGLSAMGLLARASSAATVTSVQGGWRGMPMQIQLSDGTTVVLTQNTGTIAVPDPRLMGLPLWQAHVGMMLSGTLLFVLVAFAAVTRASDRMPLLLQRRESRGIA